jgi:hypothetical protein
MGRNNHKARIGWPALLCALQGLETDVCPASPHINDVDAPDPDALDGTSGSLQTGSSSSTRPTLRCKRSCLAQHRRLPLPHPQPSRRPRRRARRVLSVVEVEREGKDAEGRNLEDTKEGGKRSVHHVFFRSFHLLCSLVVLGHAPYLNPSFGCHCYIATHP